MEFHEDNFLYIGTNGRVAAIDIIEGTIIWQTQLKYEGILSSTIGEDVNIIYKDGFIYAGCNGHLFCLEGNTGEIVWRNGLKGFGYGSLVLAMQDVAVQMTKKKVEGS